MESEEDKTTVDAIQRLMLELAETKGKMKAIKDDLKDIAEQNDEYRALQEELKEVGEKRATAKKMLEADKDYQVANSDSRIIRPPHERCHRDSAQFDRTRQKSCY